jgi:2-polyprenylphenol 6-hydroxylase
MSGVLSMDDMACDVCVVGAGMVGSAIALAAAQRGMRVVVWERQPPAAPPNRLGMGVRTVALSPATERFLGRLGVTIDGTPMTGMHIWEEIGTAQLDFSAVDLAVPMLGRIIENHRLVAQLWDRLQSDPAIQVRLGSQLQSVTGDDHSVRLCSTTGTVTARLCVAADGAASTVRGLTGEAPHTWDSGQTALATIVRVERGHAGVAYQRFLHHGPVALLPGNAPDLCSVVWSMAHAEAATFKTMSDQQFCAALTRATEAVLGNVLAVDNRVTFPLVQQLARDMTPARRVVLVGDAARVLHPLAGMGVNVGFEDAALLDRLFASGADPGDLRGLRTYARKRRVRGAALIGLMAGFQHVYAWQSPGLNWLRNVGVRLVNGQALIKRQLLREALGLGPVAQGSY